MLNDSFLEVGNAKNVWYGYLKVFYFICNRLPDKHRYNVMAISVGLFEIGTSLPVPANPTIAE